MSEPDVLRRVIVTLCEPCLLGEGGECHTPGCALWMSRGPDAGPIEHELTHQVTIGAEEVVEALQEAWNDFCADTDCVPDDFIIHGPGTTRVTAAFGRGNFCGMVADSLNRARNA